MAQSPAGPPPKRPPEVFSSPPVGSSLAQVAQFGRAGVAGREAIGPDRPAVQSMSAPLLLNRSYGESRRTAPGQTGRPGQANKSQLSAQLHRYPVPDAWPEGAGYECRQSCGNSAESWVG